MKTMSDEELNKTVRESYGSEKPVITTRVILGNL